MDHFLLDVGRFHVFVLFYLNSTSQLAHFSVHLHTELIGVLVWIKLLRHPSDTLLAYKFLSRQ